MNIIFNDNDIYCNMDRFKNKDINICFVTGFSGSGKSTLAKSFASKNNATYVELDYLIYFGRRHDFTKERLDNVGQSILYEYIISSNKFPGFMKELCDKKDNVGILKEAIEYTQWLNDISSKKRRFVIEGVDLVRIIPANPVWYEYPIIFKGTPMLKSMMRKIKRDGFGKARENINNPVDFLRWIKELFQWYNEMNIGQDFLRNEMIMPGHFYEKREETIHENFSQVTGKDGEQIMDLVTESSKELSVYDRKQAIKLFQSTYVGRFDITYFDTNKDRKHDRIIAEISKKDAKDATNYIAGIIKTLNNKKGHNFVFIYHKGYIIANEKKSSVKEAYSIYSIPGDDDPSTSHLKSADDRDPIYDRFNSTQQTTSSVQYSGEMDETEEFYLHDLQKIPLVSHYVNELHMSPKTAVNVIEAFLAENPYLNMYLINESSFKTQEAYDDALLDAFIAATEASNGNIELYNDALDYSTEFFYNLDESFYTEESVVRNRGIIDRAKHSIKKTLSPIAQNIVNQVDALIGDKAAKEEVITGSSLLKARRLFLKMIVMWKVPAILSALSILPGGWLGLILKIVIWVGSKASSLRAMKNLVSTGTGLGNGNDAIHDENTKLVLNELDLELKITREKIDDAKSKGDTKAKYQLMRIENNIEREIFRIKYGKTPDRSFVGERGH